MAHPSKRKGDQAEREVALLLSDLTGFPVRRKLGAGAKDDTGDLDGIPDTCVEVKNRPGDPMRSIREGLAQLKVEQANAGCTFGVLLVRRRGGEWIAVMDLEQVATLLREAVTPDDERKTA